MKGLWILKVVVAAAVVLGTGWGAGPAAAAPGEKDAEAQYKKAQGLLDDEKYESASAAFHKVSEDYPATWPAAYSLYWEAFSLYKIGGKSELRDAVRALEKQFETYPDEANLGDSRDLAIRIQGALAEMGEARAAERITVLADEMTERMDGSPALAPTPPRPPRPGEAPAVPPLPAGDFSNDTRVAALNALLQMRSDRAVPILTKILHDPGKYDVEMRRQAVFLLSQHQTEETEDALLWSVKNDPDMEVRENAVFWLSQVPGEKSLAALQSILEDTSEPDLQEKAVFALSQHPGVDASKLLRDLARREDVSRDVRENAIFWLSQRGSDEGTLQFLTDLYGGLHDEELQEKVIFSVSQIGGKPSCDWLLGVVRDRTQSSELRKNALFWAGQCGSFSVKDIQGFYESLDDPELKEQAIFVMSQYGCKEALDLLIHIARNDTDPEMREKAIFWIGQCDDDRAMEFLEELIGK